MASSLYKDFLNVIQKKKLKVLENVKRSRTWFRRNAQKLVGVKATDIMKPGESPGKFLKSNKLTKESVGRLIMYFYDPKHKKTLPYYDRFPLVLYLEPKSGKNGVPGFLGLNLHYLPPVERAKMLDALYSVAQKNKNNELKKIQITYGILKESTKFKYYKPCLKHYLYGHVRSKFLLVDVNEWDMVCFLPLERFEKATKEKVWKDSLNKIG
jgi:hypothetical protein